MSSAHGPTAINSQPISTAVELPAVIEGPRLSRMAVELSSGLPPFTRGQLTFHGRRRGMISDKDVEAVLGKDQDAWGEYNRISAGNPQTTLGQAMLVNVFQAYQPPVNLGVDDVHSPYALALSKSDDALIRRVREILGGIPENQKRKGEKGLKTIFDAAVVHNLVPLIAMAEVMGGGGIVSPISLTLPEVYFRQVKRFYPGLYERMRKDHREGIIDIGTSSAYHAIAPTLTRKDMKTQYRHSLEYFLQEFPPTANAGDPQAKPNVTVHIPEQAITETLFEVLNEVQDEMGIRLTVFLDSKYHNVEGDSGFSLWALNLFKNPAEKTGVRVLFRDHGLSDILGLSEPNGSDPLFFLGAGKGMQELTPEIEEAWFKAETSRIFSRAAIDFFGTGAEEGNHWRMPLFGGKPSCLTFELDAEWCGYHRRGEPVAYYRAISALAEFGIRPASARWASDRCELVAEEQRRPVFGRSWNVGFETWINEDTAWLRGMVGDTQKVYEEALEYLTALYHKNNPGAKEKDRPGPLSSALENYGRSSMSCPYWWSRNTPGFPNDVPTIRQVLKNMTACGRDVYIMLTDALEEPGRYGLDLSPEEREHLGKLREGVLEADKRFRENEWANRHDRLAKTMKQRRLIKEDE